MMYVGYPVFRGEHDLQPIIRTISQPLFAILSPQPWPNSSAPPSLPRFGGLDQYPGIADFNLHGRFRATGWLFGKSDAALAPPAAGESRVVFLGDSVTNYWKYQTIFLQALYQPRHRWADHARDAGAVSARM